MLVVAGLCYSPVLFSGMSRGCGFSKLL